MGMLVLPDFVGSLLEGGCALIFMSPRIGGSLGQKTLHKTQRLFL